jgi:NitT/TauT family transport system ATP-binding protein
MDGEKVRVEVDQTFGSFHVLDHLNFSVKENEFLCLVGPSGSGKTVLLQILAGITPPSNGEVTIDSEPIDPRRHKLGFVFQEPSCLPWRTVWDDVKFGLEIRKFGAKEIERKVSRVLEVVGLQGFEKYYPYQISGGMKQRVALARALVTDPDLLLMDEPFGQLDIKTRFHMMDEILRLWREIKATIIYVTHNLEEAVYLGQNILVLTQKPTRIKENVEVDLPHPRDYASPHSLISGRGSPSLSSGGRAIVLSDTGRPDSAWRLTYRERKRAWEKKAS